MDRMKSIQYYSVFEKNKQMHVLKLSKSDEKYLTETN